jgi:hypothetical protein
MDSWGTGARGDLGDGSGVTVRIAPSASHLDSLIGCNPPHSYCTKTLLNKIWHCVQALPMIGCVDGLASLAPMSDACIHMPDWPHPPSSQRRLRLRGRGLQEDGSDMKKSEQAKLMCRYSISPRRPQSPFFPQAQHASVCWRRPSCAQRNILANVCQPIDHL